jgi:putative membrane protein
MIRGPNDAHSIATAALRRVAIKSSIEGQARPIHTAISRVSIRGPNQRSAFMKIIGSFALAVTLGISATAAEQSAPTDPQIAGIVVTANQVDIDAGKVAVRKSHRKDVREFAQRMITDHSGVNKSAVALVTRLHVVPEDSPINEGLKMDGNENLATLKTLRGPAFDKAYVDHEVEYHQHVLGALNEVLIPNASNAELKALMVQVEPNFVAHLDHAKRIQASLAGKN